jgi:hypothetical protein
MQLDPHKREPYPYSGWDDFKYTVGGLALIAAPFALLAWLLLLQ